MKKKTLNRRDFLTATAAAGIAVSGAKAGEAGPQQAPMPKDSVTPAAAGLAAAMAAAAQGSTRDLQVKELQRRLKQVGAYLPNAQG